MPLHVLLIATLLLLRGLDQSKYLLGFGTLLAKLLLHLQSIHTITQQSANSVSVSSLLFRTKIFAIALKIHQQPHRVMVCLEVSAVMRGLWVRACSK